MNEQAVHREPDYEKAELDLLRDALKNIRGTFSDNDKADEEKHHAEKCKSGSQTVISCE